MMAVSKSAEFITDVERQFEWYAVHATWEIADRYLDAVEFSCRLLGQYPRLGPHGGFAHPRLHDWRFFVVPRPFDKHVLFYEVGEIVTMRRAMHGHRDLSRRLQQPPGSP